MTLGFNIGLQFAYLLLVLAVLVAVRWLVRGRPRPAPGVLRVGVLGVAVFVAVTALVAVPYARVQHTYPQATMPADEVAFFSPPLRAFLAAPQSDLLWGGVTAARRRTLPAPVEQTLFPGVTTLLLALVGLASCAYGRNLRIALAAGTLVCFAASLGIASVGNAEHGLSLFGLLRDHAPGWSGTRTPGRINNLTSLGLALLAGAGLAQLHRLLRSRAGERFAAVASTGLAAAILLEGFGPMPHERVPARPRLDLAAPAPQLHLPTIVGLDGIYAYWSIGSFPKMANAASSFDPRVVAEIRITSESFPNATSVGLFCSLGIRSVILHRDLARGTPWAKVPARSIAGLPITRHDAGNLVIYRLPTRGSRCSSGLTAAASSFRSRSWG
jgi:hypothetical protein